MTDTQTALAYLGQAALLLRRRAHRKATVDDDASQLVKAAASIQKIIDAVHLVGPERE